MLKIRLIGSEKEITDAVEKITASFRVLEVSDAYPTRNGKELRVYISAENQ